MNDHIHFIVLPENPNNLPKIIRLIKVNFTVNVNERCENSHPTTALNMTQSGNTFTVENIVVCNTSA